MQVFGSSLRLDSKIKRNALPDRGASACTVVTVLNI